MNMHLNNFSEEINDKYKILEQNILNINISRIIDVLKNKLYCDSIHFYIDDENPITYKIDEYVYGMTIKISTRSLKLDNEFYFFENFYATMEEFIINHVRTFYPETYKQKTRVKKLERILINK